jgi:drug/metabolite transporter (DMT)-like permease
LAYLQMVWAVGYGYLIFGQLSDRWSAIGISVIVASGLLLALQERQRARWPRANLR